MKVCTNNALKKIEVAGGKTDVSASASATPKKAGGKKRKATPTDDEEAACSIKKGRKGKKNGEAPADGKLPFDPPRL